MRNIADGNRPMAVRSTGATRQHDVLAGITRRGPSGPASLTPTSSSANQGRVAGSAFTAAAVTEVAHRLATAGATALLPF